MRAGSERAAKQKRGADDDSSSEEEERARPPKKKAKAKPVRHGYLPMAIRRFTHGNPAIYPR